MWIPAPCPSGNSLEDPGFLVKSRGTLPNGFITSTPNSLSHVNLLPNPFLSLLRGKPALARSLRSLLGGGNGVSLELGWGSLGQPDSLPDEPCLMLSRLWPTPPTMCAFMEKCCRRAAFLPPKWENEGGVQCPHQPAASHPWPRPCGAGRCDVF